MTLGSARIQQCPLNPHPQGGRGLRRRCAFTLVELLVVMGVIAVLASLTLVSVRAITDNARLSSATNTVMAALDNARALAMKKNTIVLVVFRPRFEGNNKQVVEVVTAKWSGESYLNGSIVIDRFVPIPDVPIRGLSTGIKVAAPSYGLNQDDMWVTQTHLPAIDQQAGTGEWPGGMVGVMYGPDGTTLSRNSQSDSNRTWVDFLFDATIGARVRADLQDIDPSNPVIADFFEQKYADDETFITIAPFVAVFDDESAREVRATDWTSQADYEQELTGPLGHITQFADRIHFNRYTGVAMK